MLSTCRRILQRLFRYALVLNHGWSFSRKMILVLFCPRQGAMPDIIGNTKEEFFSSKLEMVKKCAEICYEELMKIPCITCPCKPEGSMFTMVMNRHEPDYSLVNLKLKLRG